MKKSELQSLVEELEGRMNNLEDRFDILRADVHGSRDPYNNHGYHGHVEGRYNQKTGRIEARIVLPK